MDKLASTGQWALTLLNGELGQRISLGEGAGLDGWQQLALSQSVLLSSGWTFTAEGDSSQETEDEGEALEQGRLEKETDSLVVDGSAADSTAEGDDATTEEPTTEEDSGVVARTITASSRTVTANDISLNNNTEGKTVDLTALLSRDVVLTAAAEGEPVILITHTHATEAYTPSGDDQYEASDNSRTTDENYNMLRVGDEMKTVFERMGLVTLHDTSLYDYPSYNGSYARSLAGVQAILEEYPSIQIVLDVHRDALIASDGTVYKAVTEVEGQQVAQVMLVVGTDDGGLTHPNWKDNLAVALKLQQALVGVEPTLARPVNLRSQRFNQHLTAASLLVEVGTSGNTLQEALAGARLFARAAGEVYLELLGTIQQDE